MFGLLSLNRNAKGAILFYKTAVHSDHGWDVRVLSLIPKASGAILIEKNGGPLGS